MKIFEFTSPNGMIDFVAGNRVLEATCVLCCYESIDIDELDTTEVRELPKKEWDDHYIGEYQEYSTMEGQTFTEWMKNREEPSYITGTKK
jgi:preprotein translocase subunit Sec63